ncbi:hypothetical protein NT6N_37730 [Oceaniferula spumae]|uniref:Ice-binding protein C-terminal domain-containing protein n=1 Tax=Oceaniferula spumae TaxID=2979115 RepID=A0AAT9FRW7_9BACT
MFKQIILPLSLLASVAYTHAAVILSTSESNFSTNQGTALNGQPWAGDISTTDLVHIGQSTYSGRSYSVSPTFGSNGVNNGGINVSTSNSTYWNDATLNSQPTVTFDLDVSTNTQGYDITAVDVFQGWNMNSAMHANQNYTISVSTVGSAVYTPLITVNYNPFGTANDSHHYSHTQVTEDSSGIIASGVDSIRIQFLDPVASGGNSPGIVVNEIDVQGVATVPEPSSAALLGLAGLGALLRRRR